MNKLFNWIKNMNMSEEQKCLFSCIVYEIYISRRLPIGMKGLEIIQEWCSTCVLFSENIYIYCTVQDNEASIYIYRCNSKTHESLYPSHDSIIHVHVGLNWHRVKGDN